ncbi:hypothetical protein B0H14DRAFT_2587447 [Mycena olivaceomarginata]|nr:hypothetical protein B0H14DRAFT_2587447 [Mycena olivaceomarginata]
MHLGNLRCQKFIQVRGIGVQDGFYSHKYKLLLAGIVKPKIGRKGDISTLVRRLRIFDRSTTCLRTVDDFFVAVKLSCSSGCTNERLSLVVLVDFPTHGHSMPYLDREHVTAYIALEPNGGVHWSVEEKAAEAGFAEKHGSFLLECGAGDADKICAKLVATGLRVDTCIRYEALQRPGPGSHTSRHHPPAGILS